MNVERYPIGKGGEHTVYPLPEEDGRERVVKIPNGFTALTLYYLYGGVDTLRREIQTYIDMVEGKKGLGVPKTEVEPVGKRRYRIIQDRVREDDSVADVPARLAQLDVPLLVLNQENKPSNFMSQGGTVYLVDNTDGPNVRLARAVGRN